MELQESAHAVAVSLPEIKNCETIKIKSLDRQHDDQVYQCFIRIKLHEKIFFIFKVSSVTYNLYLREQPVRLGLSCMTEFELVVRWKWLTRDPIRLLVVSLEEKPPFSIISLVELNWRLLLTKAVNVLHGLLLI